LVLLGLDAFGGDFSGGEGGVGHGFYSAKTCLV
jgi:hypothetical protein